MDSGWIADDVEAAMHRGTAHNYIPGCHLGSTHDGSAVKVKRPIMKKIIRREEEGSGALCRTSESIR